MDVRTQDLIVDTFRVGMQGRHQTVDQLARHGNADVGISVVCVDGVHQGRRTLVPRRPVHLFKMADET